MNLLLAATSILC